VSIKCERYHAVVPVADVQASIDFYTSKLGFAFDFAEGEPATFAAVDFGDNAQLFLNRAWEGSGACGLYFVVDDADAMCEICRAAGITILVELGNRPYRLRDFSIHDPDRHVLTFGHRLESATRTIQE
jgi:catechol 2,3-dioxygenase-like lactoylglutathione lyase family enzyme